MGNYAKKTGSAEKFKNSAPFNKADIIVYACLLTAVLLLFLIFVILPNKTNSQGFNVSVGDTEVLEFFYNDSRLYVKSDLYVVEHDSKNCTVTVYIDGKTEYNIIKYDCQNKTVKITESSCRGNDCVSFAEISDNGVIYCLPHNLKITPLSQSMSEPSTGGAL